MKNNEASIKTPVWMRITLFLSLAINLLVVGLVVGAFVMGGPDRRASRFHPDGGSLYTRALDKDDRKAVRRDFAARLGGQGRGRDAIIDSVETTLETLRATPFDEAALASALAQRSERRATRDALGRQALVARIAAMTDTERAAYADRVEQGLAQLVKRFRR